VTPPRRRLVRRNTHRLVASRYPTVGVFDAVARPEDLAALVDLESWTNDRLQAELGQLALLPRSEWLVGVPYASVVMAAFCHPAAGGARFSSAELGAWYAAFELRTAHREAGHRRRREFEEVRRTPSSVQMRDYLADFRAAFHDVRPASRFPRLHHPSSYRESQRLAARLRADGAAGIVYESVRDTGRGCLVAFRPRLVLRVRQGGHFQYDWDGAAGPTIRRLA
jgi:hypothetical protein